MTCSMKDAPNFESIPLYWIFSLLIWANQAKYTLSGKESSVPTSILSSSLSDAEKSEYF